MILGLLFAAGGGVFYAISLWPSFTPSLSAGVLLTGRGLVGMSESFVITAGQAWGLILLGPRHTGRVIAWVGTAMYGAFALGAPIGSIVYDRFGFDAIVVLTIIMPMATLACVAPLASAAPTAQKRGSITRTLRAVWMPGLGSAFSAVGFGAMIAFSSVLFAARGWPVWPAFSVFAMAFMASRLLLGQIADKSDAVKVALVCVGVEALGLFIVAFAPAVMLALSGCILTGLGLSLVYPAFGVEAVRRAPAQDRGLAMGAYTAFLDLALGVSGPALGLLAQGAGLASAFTASALAALASGAIAIGFLVHARSKCPEPTFKNRSAA
jgi:predicted MFS family arabinose efflux permease